MKRISIGIENFKKLIDNNYYYIDKTMLIEDVLSYEVMLYTRPRRFGKTLNMSMLYYFFSNKEKENSYLFNDLKISKHKDIEKHQNQYPVISLSLKDMKRMTMEQQTEKFASMISHIISQNMELLDSPYIDDNDKSILEQYRSRKSSINDLQDALYMISQCLYKHYQKKVIILIDEYDVPLQNAYFRGYYDEMSSFLSNVFSSALKTNDALERAVLTGCLRIAKESIFTGLNNFKVFSIFNNRSASYFGFTQEEIDELLKYYHLEEYREQIRKWYDGYLFGNKEIYNPWSTLNYIDLILDGNDQPESFWANTSSNSIVYDYIQKSNPQMRKDFEDLIQGKSINKLIIPELTYRDMDRIDNIYSFLLFTGYLKIKDHVYDEEGNIKHNEYQLVIPNKEVKEIYKQLYINYFNEYVEDKRERFIKYLREENVAQANEILNQSISYFDNYENFYHGFMIGLLSDYKVKSNKESGEGRFDIGIEPINIINKYVLIECKKADTLAKLVKESEKAAKQIIERKYLEGILNEGYIYAVGYGISFYKKHCWITLAK